MKRLICVFLLCFGASFSSMSAQEGCAIDLTEAITALTDAQSKADSGDTAAATDQIAAVSDQLNTIVSACQSGQLFPQKFVSGPLSFTYPEGWRLQSPEANIQIFGTSESAIETIFQENLQQPIASGEQVMAIIVGNYQEDYNTDNYAEFLAEFPESVETGSTRVSPADPREISPYRWDIFNLTSNGMRGALYIYDVGDSARAIVALAIAPAGEYEALVATADRVLASLRYGEKPSFAQSAGAPREPIAADGGAPLDSLTYVRAQYYEDIIGEEIGRVDQIIVSPDGQTIAWIQSLGDGVICVQALENGVPSCANLPENFRPPSLQFIWSPDGRYIAFTEDFLRLLHESDVWLYEVQTGAIVNRTDDKIDRFRFGDDDTQGPLWVDGPMAWGADGNLYFMRLDAPDPSELESSTQGLYRLQPDSGEVTLVRDLSGVFEIFSVFAQPISYFDGSMAVSPDGTQLAFTVFERDRSSIKNGVWVLALDGQSAPKQVMRSFDLRGGLPLSAPENYYSTPSGLAWSGDGKAIFVFGENQQFGPDTPNIIYRVRPDDFAVDVLTDYSAVTERELLSGDAPLINTVPRSAVMSSDRSAPLIMTFELNMREAKIEALIPTETGAERRLLFTMSDFRLRQRFISGSVATNGVFSLFGYVFFPAP